MKTAKVLTEFEARAADALKSLFGRVSAIKLIELKHESQTAGGITPILARISIYGHSHTLACDANPSGEPARLRAVLREVRNNSVSHAVGAIPVVIAPYLSPEAQALCKENKTGFVDFEGNASLNVGDFFVSMRSLPRQAATRVSVTRQEIPVRVVIDPIFPDVPPKIPHKQVPLALSA
jgi:hypothetical protein